MLQDEAKPAILAEWRHWIARKNTVNPTGTDALIFFGFLQKERADLLRFRASGDKGQVVHNWLIRAGLLSD